MKIKKNNAPRQFKTGQKGNISINDMGTIELDVDEQLTFVSGDKKEYDFTRKSWGYYATPSINGRLKSFGFKTALIRNKQGKHYIMVVDTLKIEDFEKYLLAEESENLEWLDERG